MMKKIILSLVIITLLVLLQGCGSTGSFRANNLTVVELSEPNFKYVARDLQGASMQSYLFGISVPQGSNIGTFALIKVGGADQIYDAAIKELWKNYRAQYGETEGKKLALVNIRQDIKTLNTLIFTKAELFISADVIEFVE